MDNTGANNSEVRATQEIEQEEQSLGDTLKNSSSSEFEPSESALRRPMAIRGKPIIVAAIAFGVLVIGATALAFFLQLNKPLSLLSFVPDTADYYLSIKIGKTNPQVIKGQEIAERFPGGDRAAEALRFSIEMFGRPLDPFQEVLELADEEIFLAKVQNSLKENSQDANLLVKKEIIYHILQIWIVTHNPAG